jgi:sulfane dehydrogenase subunit SoxC
MTERTRTLGTDKVDLVAGNGLMNRRHLLTRGAAVTGALSSATLMTLGVPAAAGSDALTVPGWMKVPGEAVDSYGMPSRFEKLARNPRTPLQYLDGMITPNPLHFVVAHNGVPDIDPDQHRFLIHGLVKRPLEFTLEALERYPRMSRIVFLECAGNGRALYENQPVNGDAQSIQGLLSCAEWTGVSLAMLLDEAGVDRKAKWLLAEGADAAAMSRSIPLAKALDDAFIALYQNGEPIRPSNGFPMRLMVPGFHGNMNVKWLRRIELTEGPMMTKDETSHYSMLLKDGSVAQFKFPIDAKSVITHPSPGLAMKGSGFYEISGAAWSGNGKIVKVEVSADGGRSWAPAALSEPVLSKAITRFRAPWRWDGGPAVLQSRATDDTGYVQPTREQLLEKRGHNAFYFNNAITSWGVASSGQVTHVYV